MAHKAVEVVRTGGPRINLIVHYLRLLAQILSQCLSDVSCLFQWRTVRHINDDLKLALVVERQHLEAYPLQGHKRNRGEQQDPDTSKKHPAATRIKDERVHHPAIQTGRPTFGLLPQTAANTSVSC